jgi:hypothetical protein
MLPQYDAKKYNLLARKIFYTRYIRKLYLTASPGKIFSAL